MILSLSPAAQVASYRYDNMSGLLPASLPGMDSNELVADDCFNSSCWFVYLLMFPAVAANLASFPRGLGTRVLPT